MVRRPKRVLLLGGSRYYLSSIRAAKALGLEVVLVDRNPGAEGFQRADHSEVVDIADPDGVLKVARRYRIDGILPLNDFGVQTAAFVAHSLGLVGLDAAVAARATSKYLMRKRWQDCGVPSAAWRVATTLDEAVQAVRDLDCWPLVVKPADSRGGGSRGVSVIETLEQVPDAVLFAQSWYADKTILIEEFLDGLEHSVETITFDGVTHVLAVCDNVKTPRPYRVNTAMIYPTILGDARLERVHDVVRRAVQALGISSGAAHVELCSTASGPRLFELGARCGGGGIPDPIVPFVSGVKMLEAALRIAIGEAPGDLTPRREQGCVYRFLLPPPGRLRRVVGVEEVSTWPNVLDCAVTVQAGASINAVRVGADRAGFIIAAGDTREAAQVLAEDAVRCIHFEYA
ncbi:MAG: ATP-grasp domain-containing protein [Acidobacteriota bacterium]